MYFINVILIYCVLINVNVNLNHTILHHCCFTAPLLVPLSMPQSHYLTVLLKN